MHARTLVLIVLFTLLAFGCRNQNETGAPPPPASNTVTASAAAPARQTQISGLSTPETVLYDPRQDVDFISNINGSPTALDGNGFISRVNPDTLAVDLKWIESGRNGVTLNGPKGMTIVGDTLYVADINSVRRFNRKSGALQGEIAIPGATFLNDLTNDGTAVYVSDSGIISGANGGFQDVGTDAVWKIVGDKASKVTGGAGLKEPNGLDVLDGQLWAVTFASNELYAIRHGKKTNVVTLPKGQLDGLIHLPDKTFIVTSWESGKIYRGPSSGPFLAVATVKSPAEIGYDTKRHILMIPDFTEGRVEMHPVE
ncbi:MAG TPA: hypothetical protein VKH35_00740 [Thermoanaerobaculia bacterium]|nr:hypothetical protein [Thermoanaerobaculia bacterium]